MKKIIVLLLIMQVISVICSYATPGTPTVAVRGSNHTYNNRPWIELSVCTDSSHYINDVYIEIWYYGTLKAAYFAHNYPSTFYPLPKSGTDHPMTTIRHRLQYSFSSADTYYDHGIYVRLYCNDTVNREGPVSSQLSIHYLGDPPAQVSTGQALTAAKYNEIVDALNTVKPLFYPALSYVAVGDPVMADDHYELLNCFRSAYQASTGSGPTTYGVNTGDLIRAEDFNQILRNLSLP